MKQYIGLKVINAIPMTKKVACKEGLVKEDGCEEKSLKNSEVQGHKIIDENGCESWIPKDAFNDTYKRLNNMVFGLAIEALKKGHKVARKCWNSGAKKEFLFLVPGSEFNVNRPPLLGIYPEGTEVSYHAHIDMRTAEDKIVPWVATQADMLAEDYIIIE